MSATVLAALLFAQGPGTDDQPAPVLNLHAVAVPVKSNRLLSMSMDEDGFIWVGGFHGSIHRYDPRGGSVREADGKLSQGRKGEVVFWQSMKPAP